MGNCLGFRKNELLLDYSRRLDMIKERHEREKKELYEKIDIQEEKIIALKREVDELNRKCDQMLLDYYNLEQDYARCKNELGQCQSRLGSFRNIFSL